MLKSLIQKALDSTFVHLAFAFLAMGSWAYFANRLHPPEDALKAAVLQGALSATITLFMKKSLEALSRYFFKRERSVAALFAPPLIVCSGSLALLVGSHMAAATPELFATVIIPFSVAFSYACLYTYRLWRQQHG